jgi:PPM family protein phosphatase
MHRLQPWKSRSSSTAFAVPTRTLATELAIFSEAGPVRAVNEDCVRARRARRATECEDRLMVVALADGMGGHAGGAVASELAVTAALAACTAVDAPADARRRLGAARRAAHDAVHSAAEADTALAGMGTTLVLFAPGDGFGSHVAWVGDSRLYRWRRGAVEQITRDDTVVRDLIDGGLLSPEQAASHPDRSVLSQALGTQRMPPRLHVLGPLDDEPGDRYLLCSDGVHEVLSVATLTQLLALPTASAIAEALLPRALLEGSDDNLSAAVVRLVPVSPPTAAHPTHHDRITWPGVRHDPQ